VLLSLQDLYETCARDVRRFPLCLSGNESDADDITSETSVRAWTRQTAFRTETPGAYLLTLARNVHLQQVRRDTRHVSLDDAHPDTSPGTGQCGLVEA